MRSTFTAITAVGAIIAALAAPASARPWQQAWGDYDNNQQWHDASWWLQHQHDWVTSHHPEWTENYASTHGRIGDADRFHGRHYGDGGADRLAATEAIEAANAIRGYRGGYAVVAPRDRVEVRPETQHAYVDRDKISMKDSEPARIERN
jgi:hypothetical protein